MSAKRFLKKGVGFFLTSIAPKTQVYPKVISLSPNKLLLGRTALITGGTSGIGYEIAKSYVNSGASIIITGRKQERIDEAVEKLKAETSNTQVFGIQLDNMKVPEFKEKLNLALSLV